MITISRDGDLVLGPVSAECAGVGRVAMDGAILVIDPAEPSLVGSLTIFDETLVASTLDSVLWHRDPGIDPSIVLLPAPGQDDDCRPSPALTRLLRLGELGWLESWSPDALDPVLLDLEIGRAAAEADLAVDGEEIAHERLTARISELLTLAERIRGPETLPTHPAVRKLVRDALRLSYESMTPTDAWFDDIEHEHELAAMVTAAGEGPLDWDDRRLLPDISTVLLETRALARAEHADATGHDRNRTTLSGHSSVDWRQVPRGLLDTAESTIAWDLDVRAGSIEVSVKAANRPPSRATIGQGQLAFRVLAPDGSLLGLGPLTLVAAEGALVGRSRVAETTQLEVDVFDPRLIQPPRVGPAAAVAAAERWSARAISLLRIAVGAGLADSLDRSIELLQYAGRMTELATSRAPADERQQLRGRQAQLLNLVHALAVQEERHVLQRRAANTLTRLGYPARDLRPAAELTATEWAAVAAADSGDG